MRRVSSIVLVVLLSIFWVRSAVGRIYIPIDQPADKKFPIAVADLVNVSGGGSIKKEIPDIIRNDLTLSGYFYVIPKKAYLDDSDNFTQDKIDFKKWTMIDAHALVKGAVMNEEGRTVVQLRLFDTMSGEMLVGKQYTFEPKQLRKIAHRFSDEVMLALTGMRGVFGTKIAFVRQSGKRSKSIYYMDMDGENETRVTKEKTITLGPSWSPDGKRIAFASYLDRFPDIYVYDLTTGHIRRLTSGDTLDITPTWSPDGSMIAYASTLPGNFEIYVMSSDGGGGRRITNSPGIDISPSFNPDGTEIVYVSERGSSAQIYRQSISGGAPVPVTLVGSHNVSPDWSPDGQKVVFAGRVGGGAFDIFTVNADGTNVERLTIGSGTNEDPSWSPDGRFIVFSSTRSGKQPQIFIMRYDGANQTQITKKGGMMPDWGPWED